MPYPLPLTRTEAYLAYKAGVIQLSDLKPSLAVPRNGIDAWLAYWTGLVADYPKREDGTPHILQEEEAYIAYLCGVINEYPEKCLRRVGEYLRYLISARWGRPDHPLNREELYLSLIKTQFIPSGDPSSDIVINGTAKAAFVDVKMYGDTFQQSYTGKNLYNVAEVTTGAYVTKDDDGWITITRDNTSGSSTVYTGASTDNLALETSTQYKIFLEVKAVSGTGTLYITSNESTGTEGQFSSFQLKTLASMTAGQTYTFAPYTKPSFSGITNGLRTFLQQTAGQGGSVTFRLSVCAYTTPTETFSYEPYTGGQASPSPDYPQQIQTVTGEQTVTVTGKNLVDSSLTMVQGFVSNYGTIDTNTPYQDYYLSSIAPEEYIPVSADTDYTFSWTPQIAGSCVRNVAFYDGSKACISRVQNAYSVNPFSVTTPSGCAYIRFNFYNFSGMTPNNPLSTYLTNFQLEKGNTVTSFEPYAKHDYPLDLGSIELCKLGTYQDYIWKDGESWKVHKATVSAIIDGSESWDTSGTNTFYVANIYSKIGNSIQSTSTGEMYASHFTIVDISGSNTLVGASLKVDAAHNVSNLRIRLQDMSGGTAGFRQMLSAKKPSIYARRLTPTDTTITDTNLIAQLDSLVNGGAEDGTTYIKVNATDPNLPGLLYVEAPKYE